MARKSNKLWLETLLFLCNVAKTYHCYGYTLLKTGLSLTFDFFMV